MLCLANDLEDLKARLARLVVGYTYGKASEQKPVTAGQLHAEGAMCALLKDALKPNLVQTLEHTPAIRSRAVPSPTSPTAAIPSPLPAWR